MTTRSIGSLPPNISCGPVMRGSGFPLSPSASMPLKSGARAGRGGAGGGRGGQGGGGRGGQGGGAVPGGRGGGAPGGGAGAPGGRGGAAGDLADDIFGQAGLILRGKGNGDIMGGLKVER